MTRDRAVPRSGARHSAGRLLICASTCLALLVACADARTTDPASPGQTSAPPPSPPSQTTSDTHASTSETDQPSGSSTAKALPTGSVASQSFGVPTPGQVKTTAIDHTGTFPAFEGGWDTAGRYLIVILRGSSSCRSSITGVTKTGQQQLTLTTPPSAAVRSCTADLASFTAEIVVPPGIVRSKPLQVEFGTLTLLVPAQLHPTR